MQATLLLVLQALILGVGIYASLRFLQTSRGSGLVRGLVVALLVGAVGLLGLAKWLELEELEHIIQSVTGFVVVILAILFQPELRRGIAQLGEHPFLGRFLAKRHQETVNEVVLAVNAMAGRRVGALIAFEREFALDAYIDNAVKVDSDVNRLVLESLFHPGSALHDGAVVIRKDRIAAASCLFPLTENIEISKSTGTRHRAALGLTEETDAVTVAVSEETGGVAICRRGKMLREVPAHRVEEVLRESLGNETPDAFRRDKERDEEGHPVLRALRYVFLEDPVRKLVALSLAAGLLFVAHQDITDREDLTLRVVAEGPGAPGLRQPLTLTVRLPGDEYRLVQPLPTLNLKISGTRARLAQARGRIYGVVDIEPSDDDLKMEFPLSEVVWNAEQRVEISALGIEWPERKTANLVVERLRTALIDLSAANVELDTEALDPRFVAAPEKLTFSPTSVSVTGPRDLIDELTSADGEERFLLEPLVVTREDNRDLIQRLNVAADLAKQGVTLTDRVLVTLPILPVLRDLGTVEKEVAVVNLRPGREKDAERFVVSTLSSKARFRVRTRGILPPTAGDSPATSQEGLRVRNWVQAALQVFVDTAELEEVGDRTLRVRWLLHGDWRRELQLGGLPLDERAEILVELLSEPEILLSERNPAESGGD